jgi:hypothetical protein
MIINKMEKKELWRAQYKETINQPTDINVDIEWRILEKKMMKRKRRPVLFFFLAISVIGASFLTWFMIDNQSNYLPLVITETSHSTKIEDEKRDIVFIENEDSVLKSATPIENKTGNPSNYQNLSLEKKELRKIRINENIIIDAYEKDALVNMDNDHFIKTNQNKEWIEHQNDSLVVSKQIQNLSDGKTIFEIKESKLYPLKNDSIHITDIDELEAKRIENNEKGVPSLTLLHRNNKLIKYVSFSLFGGLVGDKYISKNGERIDNKDLPRSQYSIGLSTNIGVRINNTTSLLAGARYIELNEKLVVKSITKKPSIIGNQPIGTYIDSKGSSSNIIGDKNIIESIEKTSIRYNELRTLNFTLGLEKDIKLLSNRLQLLGGLSIPVISNYNGHILSQNDLRIIKKADYNLSDIELVLGVNHTMGLTKDFDLQSGLLFSKRTVTFQDSYTRSQKNVNVSLGLIKNF